MRVSLEWLSEYVDLVLDAGELAERLTASGTEVAGIETYGSELEGLLVGKVLEVGPHPAADRLSLCRVDRGGEVLDVVCGAPNVAPEVLAPFAPPGTRLPDGTPIKEATIRGVKSSGMLLSGMELGISEDASGIMLLEGEPEPGTPLAAALGMPDTVLDLEITPNRPDCLSLVGMAREVAALTGQKLRLPSFSLREKEERAEDAVRVDILDPDLCSRYAARVIDALKIGGSPWWMRRRLQAAGVRPISNVVDVTNYVMLELGQPLHAFDYFLVKDGHIIVRRAEPGETLTTLDGVQRQLSRDDLLICDPTGAVALAGVMGGENTEINEATTRVLLESAHFEPANIMRTSRLHELSSEASYRFERGVDPGGCAFAAGRAAWLMQELAGGEAFSGVVDARARVIEPLRLPLRVKRAAWQIGISLSGKEAAELLTPLGLEVKGSRREGDEETLEVEIPTFRPDLEREIDLVEEVARLYGYDRVPATLPLTSHNIGGLSAAQRRRRDIARILAGFGLHEAITFSFIAPSWLETLDPARAYLPEKALTLRNPLSEEASMLRPTLIPGLLEAARFNLNRRITDLALFEMGKVFLHREGEKLPHEPLRLGCLITGRWLPKQWDREPEEADFYTAKGVLEGLLSRLRVADWGLERKDVPFLRPAASCAVVIAGEAAGFLGMIHPATARALEVPEVTALMELEVEALLASSGSAVMYREIPRYPSVQEDIAVVVEEEADAGRVEEVIREAGGELLREVRLFDLYRGEQLGEGRKSLAYTLSFYAMDRTLRDEEVRAAHERIVAALKDRLGASLRA